MIGYHDILKAVVETLHSIYPNIPVYGDQVTEGYKMPCFFIQILPIESETETKNFLTTQLMIVISYFSACKDNLENLKVMSKIKRQFGISLYVEDRHFTIRDSTTEKTDTEVHQFSFNIIYKELINFEEENELIKTIEHSIEGRNK